MKTAFHLIGAASLALGAAFPVWADVDILAMRCGDYAAMDAAGQNVAADALVRWATSTENASACGTISAQLGCGTGDVMSTTEVKSLIARHCTGKAADANVVQELRAADM
jgi:hypothetical protein